MIKTLLSQAFLIGLFAGTIRMAAPILFASLGEIFAQRSGVLNLGLEGMMVVGAFTGFAGAYYTGNPWLGVVSGMAGGGLWGLLMAFMSVTLRANQTITGIMIVLTAGGLVTFLNQTVFGGSYIPPRAAAFKALNIPLLSQIPILGPILFQQNILVYLAFLLVPVSALVLFRTTLGLKITAVGENPRAADALGVNVYAIRYLCVVLDGIMAGLGGTFLTLGYMNMFTDWITAGRGWIAISLVIFGRWNPYGALGGALLFGGVNALQLRFQMVGVAVPYQFALMLPYLLTIIVLVSVSGKTAGSPAALCVPYVREEG